MAADLQPIIDDMTEADTVMDAAVIFIEGVPGLIQAAVDASLQNGATAAQLQPVSDLAAVTKTKADALQAALQPPPPGP
jgi:hypothetical protein